MAGGQAGSGVTLRRDLIDAMDEISYDGTSGEVKDSSDWANHGKTYGNISIVEGKNGNCVDFDGVNDYIVIPSDTELKTENDQLTLEAWICPENFSTTYQRIITKYWQYYLSLSEGYVYFQLTRGFHSPIIVSREKVPLGQWTHVAVTWDSEEISLYINSKLEAFSPSTGSVVRRSNPVYVGSSEGEDLNFDGKIDEVKIYDRCLGPLDITKSYLNSFSNQSNSLLSEGFELSGSEMKVVPLEWTVTPGIHDIYAVVGAQDIDEYNNTDNLGKVQLKVLPDYKLREFATSIDAPVGGEKMQINVTVDNTGYASSVASLRVYDNSLLFDTELIAKKSINLSPGTSQKISFDWTPCDVKLAHQIFIEIESTGYPDLNPLDNSL